jgi:hypothetical protein
LHGLFDIFEIAATQPIECLSRLEERPSAIDVDAQWSIGSEYGEYSVDALEIAFESQSSHFEFDGYIAS